MGEQEYVLLIMNCWKYRDKAAKQKATWLASLDPRIRVFHVLGRTLDCGGKASTIQLQTTSSVIDSYASASESNSRLIKSSVIENSNNNDDNNKPFRFDEAEGILHVDVPDDYVSLPKKVVAALDAVRCTYSFRYIFKTDDDQMLVFPGFFKTLIEKLNKNPEYDYGGHIVDIKQPYWSEYHKIHPELPAHLPLYPTTYCSGRFYFLSKGGVKEVLRKRRFIEKEFLEDYAVGFYLSKPRSQIMPLPTGEMFRDMVE